MRYHTPVKKLVRDVIGFDKDTLGPAAGEIGGFPYNSLKETTWS